MTEICANIRCDECDVPTTVVRLEFITVLECSLCRKCVAVMVKPERVPCPFCWRTDISPDDECPWGCVLRNGRPGE
jgi:hypothetical protein